MRCIIILLLLSATSCKQATKKPTKSTVQTVAPLANQPINYDSCKKAVMLTKQKHAGSWKNLAAEKKEKIFTETVTKTIIPNWIGTAWSFYGTSQKPQQGSIACGYFVTTILQDGGVALARIKLAQCASEQMITTLVQPKLVKRFSNLPISNFIASVKQTGYGLYIVGLDNHTGFIYNDGTKIHFIHSTYVGTRNVQWEDAEKSWVLASSKYKVLGKISEDEKILERWIKFN
ncbi:MAG: hypothetical protein IPP48_13600 [Chitinophagaceae bacterium]|nr:hypothetical protein [Chitinophagaceae bacterium]